jgi:hypothetical protein
VAVARRGPLPGRPARPILDARCPETAMSTPPASASPAPRYAAHDEALELLAPYGPELANGLTSHAPMVAEALCALGRPGAVMPWLARYRAGLLPRPPARGPIDPARWRDALGRPERVEDWSRFFGEALREGAWPDVVRVWGGRLAPGLAGDATHGVIRLGHAVRALGAGASPARLRELADGLALLAAGYQELPGMASKPGPGLRPAEAIGRVPVVPPAQRRFRGTIVSSLEALAEFPPFGDALGLLDLGGDPSALLSELTDTFARVFLANARDELGAIVFVHAVTSVAAVRTILPRLAEADAHRALGFAWQASCALYAAFGERPEPAAPVEAPGESPEALADRAVAHGDEHAIKFAEACLREHALRPSPAYLAAARSALDLLPRAGTLSSR